MSTLTLSLDETVLTTLRNRATQLGVSIEQYTASLVRDQTQPAAISSKEFRELLAETIVEDDDLYRRLAK
jgi:hypothetical protein